MSEGEPIAIIGMACRFAGAASLEEFWQILVEGRDTVTEVPPDRWDANALYDPDADAPGKIKARLGGFLRDLDRFDAAFFGISPREAPHVDPRQRLMLEVAWEALEDAGIPAETLAGTSAGVYVATLTNDFDELLSRDPSRFQYHTATGSANSVVANRISYVLDLHGPSIALDTACSGSLVAIDRACQDLSAGRADLALAGGVSINLLPKGDVLFSRAGALSSDGRCRTFDADANGFVRAEAAGLVLLKPLSRARAERNRIYALIRATAVNHGGRSNGLMAPNGLAQEALLREAYRRAAIPPSEVQYVEAHGTGTPIGDPIEVGALAAVLGHGRAPAAPCVLGALKTNIGHPEAAAGVAGVIKVALALSRGIIPPVVHFQQLNPMIAALDFPLRVYQRAAGWPDPSRRLIAGVSAFGFAGTNAHAVLEQAPPTDEPAADDGPCVLALSARSHEALAALARRYVDFFQEQGAGYAAPEICRAAALGRSQLDYRLSVAAERREDLVAGLAAYAAGDVLLKGAHVAGPVSPDRPRLAFVFSGQGAHWLGMGRELWDHEPLFRQTLETCAEAHARLAGWRLTDHLLQSDDAGRWNDQEVVQPLIFAFQVALAALWRSWGVTPDIVVGQSLGEIAAAHVAGALTLEEATQVVWHRSRLLMTRAGMGKTAMVGLPLAEAQLALAGYEAVLSIAGSTGPSTSLISGDPEALRAVLSTLAERDVFHRLLESMDFAAHSPQVEPVLGELAESLREIQPRSTTIPLLSTVTGTILAGESLDAAYWARNLREPFRFAEAIATLSDSGFDAFLEVSPHPVLGGAMRQNLAQAGRAGTVLESLVRQSPERARLLATAGALFTIGYPVDWRRVYGDRGRHVPLPGYPWQRERYWFEETASPAGTGRMAGAHPLLGEHVQSPAWPGRHLWELDLRAHSLRYLRDHRVQDTVVFPGAALLEMLLAAGAAAELPCGSLVDVRFLRVLALGDDTATRLQVVLSPAQGDHSTLEVFSRPANGVAPDAWSRHASCTLIASEPRPDESPPDLAALRRRCPEPLDVAEMYAAMDRRDLQYGPAFQVVREIWRTTHEAIGRIELPDAASGESATYHAHPTLLDGCFQIAATLLPPSDSGTYLPCAVGRLLLSGSMPARLWCHARLDAASAPGAPEIQADLLLFDLAGALVGRVDRLVARRQDGAAGRPPPHGSPAARSYTRCAGIPPRRRYSLHAARRTSG